MRSVARWRSLYVQVLIAIAVGILLGTCWPHFAQQLKPRRWLHQADPPADRAHHLLHRRHRHRRGGEA
jgi:hypothetical protein